MNNFFTINNKKIFYRKIGKGNPIILLHGITSSSNTWNEISDVLSEIRTVYLIDFRGHGNSEHFNSYKWIDYSNDIVAFIEKVIGTPTEILGHSLGACIAAQVASLSNNVKSLILEDPPFFHHSRLGVEGIRARFKYNLSLAKSFNSKEEIFEILSNNSKLSNVKNLEMIAENLSNLDHKVLEETINGSALKEFSSQKIIKKNSYIKTLLLVGDEKKTGQVIVKKEIDFIKKNIKNLSFKNLNCGHNIHEEMSEKYKEIILDFVN